MTKDYGKTKAGKDRKRPARPGEGRPTKYNEEIADKICKQLTEGKSLKRLIEDDNIMPHISTIFDWINSNQEFADKYARARKVQAEFFVDEIIDISDKGGRYYDGEGNLKIDATAIQRARLMVDTRKWYASKVLPKMYGDRLQVDDVSNKEPVVMNVNLSKE